MQSCATRYLNSRHVDKHQQLRHARTARSESYGNARPVTRASRDTSITPTYSTAWLQQSAARDGQFAKTCSAPPPMASTVAEDEPARSIG
jgi:hypothetical protein